MGVDLRSEIFRLRQQDPPISMARIAQQLGITKSRVQRELDKTARERSTGQAAGDYIEHVPPTGDPALDDQRRLLESDRLDLQRIDLQTKRLEAARRLQLLEHPDGAGNGNALAAIVLQELSRLREAVARPPTAPAAPPQPSLIDQLSQFRQMADTVASFAPPKAPSSSVELEFKVAMERLNLENQQITRRFEIEADERRERMASQRSRDEAIARAIDQAAPLLTAAAENWFKEKAAPSAQPSWSPTVIPGGASAVPSTSAASAPPAAGLIPGEVAGECPVCGKALAITTPTGPDDRCPQCGQLLMVVDGAIRARLPNGQPVMPASRGDGPPRFAS
jgi:hypothetical protein